MLIICFIVLSSLRVSWKNVCTVRWPTVTMFGIDKRTTLSGIDIEVCTVRWPTVTLCGIDKRTILSGIDIES